MHNDTAEFSQFQIDNAEFLAIQFFQIVNAKFLVFEVARNLAIVI